MTHFTVGIIIPTHALSNIEDYIAGQMAPYDESLEVEPYVSYSLEQAKIDIERDIQRFERIIERETPSYNLEKCREHLETLRVTTPEQRYRDYVEYHRQFDPDGIPQSTYNPDSKWDWYVVGGRWDGWINDRETSTEAINDNLATTEEALARKKMPHAIVTPDGEWHEHGQMGWFGIMLTENEHWETQEQSIFAKYPGHHIIILDAHI